MDVKLGVSGRSDDRLYCGEASSPWSSLIMKMILGLSDDVVAALTIISNVSETLPPFPSLAVIVIVTVPACDGVPEMTPLLSASPKALGE